MIEIDFRPESVKKPAGQYKKLLKAIIEEVMKQNKPELKYEISVSVVDKQEIQDLNREYRDKDSVTDVLSFPSFEDGAIEKFHGDRHRVHLGDIVICFDKAVEQAEEYGFSVEREFAFLAAHGVLHLLGFDHEKGAEDEKTMIRLQEAALEKIGLTKN